MAGFNQKLMFSTGLRTTLCLITAAGFCCIPVKGSAKETTEPVDQSALKALARDFVARIGGKLKAHDEKVAQDRAGENPLSQVPEGEMLLLRPKAERFVMDGEIAAIKHKGAMYYSLTDIISQLEMSVNYDPEKKSGYGWYLREDWIVKFDFPNREVMSRNERFTVGEQDTYEDGGDLYISADAAKRWLQLETKPDIAQQYVNIRTPFPFPALARNYREKQGAASRTTNRPVLPRQKTEYKNLDINAAEIQHSVRYTKNKDSDSVLTQRNIATAEGDVLGHGFYGTSTWDNTENLTSIRARLTKEDEDPVLLGSLGARSYAFGDVDLPSLPLTGSSSQELGARISNNPLRNADFQSTVISGDAIPGWDVELYRDGTLVDRLRVEGDSRYEFQDIQLFAGDNLFEVFFYGPQGEIRSDRFNIPVNEQYLATQDNTYDVSVSLNDAQVYTKTPSEDEDANTAHVIARYNMLIGDTLTYTGLRAREVDGDQKAYLGAGFTHIWNGFIFDGNAAADEQAATSLDLGIRKNIDDWRLSLRGNMQDEDYVADGDDVSLLGAEANATKNFRTAFNSYTTLTAGAQYNERLGGLNETVGRFSVSNQIGRFALSSTTTYTRSKFDSEDTVDPDDRIDNSVSARYSIGRFFLRGGVDYNIQPETQISRYFSQFSWKPTNRFGSDLILEHTPESNYSEAELNLNYKHNWFRISPFAAIDTNSRFQTGVRLTTSLYDDPNKALPQFTSDRVIGRGLVSSFVFHDKNGNNIFDSGTDEALPGVIVESVNISRRATTDEKGYSLIRDLPESVVTDIRVDKASLPDPFMIPGFDGVSIFPKAGQMVELFFPIHLAGEIEGTISVRDQGILRDAGRISLDLIPLDGQSAEVINTQTAGDGYYVVSNVRPGNYLLTINSTDAARLKAGGISPVPIHIGYDGTVLTRDFELQKGRPQVPLTIQPYTGTEYQRPFFALETGARENRSTLSRLLEKMIEKRIPAGLNEGMEPIAMEGANGLKVLPGKDWNAHYERCQQLNDARIACKMILFVPKGDNTHTKTAQK